METKRWRYKNYYLTRRGKRYYANIWSNGKLRSFSLKTERIEEAKARIVKLADESTSHQDISLSQAFITYCDEHKVASEETSRNALAIVLKYYGDRMLSTLTYHDHERLIKHLEDRGFSQNYIYTIIIRYKASLNWAVRRFGLSVDSLSGFRNVGQPASRSRVLEIHEIRSLLKASRYSHLSNFILLSLATGARPGAILELTPDQMDLDNGLIYLNPAGRTQTDKRRPTVPMCDFVRPLVSSEERIIHYGGRPIIKIAKGFRTLCRNAGVENAQPRDFRATVNSRLHAMGAPESQIYVWMGHSEGRTNDRYLHLRPDYLQAPRKILEEFYREIISDNVVAFKAR